ncbi:aryl-alcohol dehydrogenase-like predicted oxidoreductase [Chitinophaga dinghuensis]|uniref:Aryl-alcohol dehydrogenase-like predicted oxidoreductase n=1 Tax=Chitinophaga dinghuensis TaxID=1539050 RepID=A0A327WCM4_9BACT|nr:aldo/keto reductase [Chitinophaga dinghuensis]RAJ87301.1 aryl-alcohol dehydrogenase-like predicted oxidoreductase [Chitinophaga dinghuensis]
MQYHQLGPSELLVSEITFGCMSLGTDNTANARLIGEAWAQGINLFDTADLYDHGRNEETLGKALKSIAREKVLIASKVGNQWKPDNSGWDWNPRKEYILSAVEASLRRLQTDYIDLYQLHGGTMEDPIDETIEAFEQLVQQGKIRYYGISSIRPQVIREYVKRSRIVSVMMQYSLLDRRPEESCFPLLQEHNIGVLARGTVAKGLLVGKAPAQYLNYTAEEVQAAAAAIAIAAGEERTASQTAIRYVLQQPAVSTAVLGIRTTSHLQDAISATTAPTLTPGELRKLNASIPINKYEQHR